MWNLNVPFIAVGSVLARAPNTTLTASTANAATEVPPQQPLQAYEPTMMEKWLLTGLWLPIGLQVQPKAAETASASLLVNLLYGGDVIWSQSKEIPGLNATNNTRNVIVSESLNQPIEIRRGRRLILEAQLVCAVETSIMILELSTTNVSQGFAAFRQGTITYDSVKLSGHREL